MTLKYKASKIEVTHSTLSNAHFVCCLHYYSDFCFGYRESDHLFSCGIPKSSLHHPGTVYMPTDRKCDDVRNCLDGEDEKHCSSKL